MRSPSVRLILRAISILVLLASIGWLIYEPGFEPGIAFLLAIAGILASRERAPDTLDAKRKKHFRNVMLQKVRTIWIHGLLENSLYGAARLELGLKYNPDAVDRPWAMTLERPGQPNCPLPPGTSIYSVFKELGSMLTLGEPGSGKTTTLLELARHLLDCAEADENQPVPIVFNLSSWSYKQPPIAEWLVDELNTVYKINKKYGQAWLQEETFHLLLDGLDEVKPESRNDCIEAINKFQQEYGPTNLVICSRTAEYKSLATKLQLMGAIVIRPLTRKQVDSYLAAGGAQLAGTRLAVNTDALLRELTQSPLVLSIVALVYHDKPVTELAVGSIAERRNTLFAAYVQRMFERRFANKNYSQEQAIHWLFRLASQMSQQSQTLFYIEHLQPGWLQTEEIKRIYQIGLGLVVGLFIGLLGGLVVGLFFGLFFGLLGGLTFGLLLGLLGGGFFLTETERVETVKWSWNKVRKRVFFGLLGGLVVGTVTRLVAELVKASFNELLSVLLNVLLSVLFGGLVWILLEGLSVDEIDDREKPNQGTWKAAYTAIRVGLFFGLFFGLLSGLAWGLVAGLFLGLFAGLFFGFLYGGENVLHHILLRFLLYRNGSLPWRLVSFLDNMASLILLRKVGGGYIFIHRMLMEYFISLEPVI